MILAYGIHHTIGTKTASSFFHLGLEGVHSETVITSSIPTTGLTGLFGNVLLANVAQLFVSVLYFTYNNLLTCMITGREWSHFAWQRKGLRVSSSPKGHQRGTYALSLPYRYAIFVLGFSAILHWLVSQSLFLIAVKRYDPDGEPVCLSDYCHVESVFKGNDLTTGWSPLAVMLVIVMGSLMVMYAFVLGTRKYKPGIPLAGGDSAVISAACHPQGEDLQRRDLAQLSLTWGVVRVSQHDPEGQIMHCSFSSQKVELPVKGQLYA